MCPIPKIAKSAIYHSTLVQNTIFSPYLSFPWWCPRCSSWACACGGTAWPPSPGGPRGWPWSRGTSASPAPWTQAEVHIPLGPENPLYLLRIYYPGPIYLIPFVGGGGEFKLLPLPFPFIILILTNSCLPKQLLPGNWITNENSTLPSNF